MSNKFINELDPIDSIVAGDELIIYDESTSLSKKASMTQVKNFINPVAPKIRVADSSSFGSEAGNRLFVFTTIPINNGGSSISYVSNAVEGDYFEILQNGLYYVQLSGDNAATAANFGISVNLSPANRLVNIQSLSFADGMRVRNFAVTSRGFEFGVFLNLVTGDKVYAHSGGTLWGSSPETNFFDITKIN